MDALRPPLETQPRLTTMTVHCGSVTLEYEADVRLEPGRTAIDIRGIAGPDVHPRRQIRASCARVVGVSDRVERPRRSPELRPDRLRGDIAGAEALLELIDQLEPPRPAGRADPERAWQAMQWLEETRRRADVERRAAQARRTALDPAGARDAALRSILRVTVSAASAGPCRLFIRAEGAWGTWRPDYRVLIADASARVSAHAHVWHGANATADQVDIELTGRSLPRRPTRRSSAPWIVRSDPGYEERSAALQLRRGAAAAAAPPTENLPDRVESDHPNPSPPQGPPPSAAVARWASGRGRVAPDRFPVALGDVGGEARWRYVVRPALDPIVHAFLEVVPAPDDRWPEGPATIVVDDVVRSRLTLPVADAEHPWLVPIGPEPRIVAHRRVHTELRVEGRMARGDVHMTTIDIELHSRLPRPVELTVEERVPVSVDPRVRVRIESPVGDTDPATGWVRSSIRVPADGDAALSLRYRIEAPHDYRLVQALGSEG